MKRYRDPCVSDAFCAPAGGARDRSRRLPLPSRSPYPSGTPLKTITDTASSLKCPCNRSMPSSGILGAGACRTPDRTSIVPAPTRPVRRLRTVIARAQAPEVCLRLERVSACRAALEEIFLFSSSLRWALINLPLVNAGCPGKRWLRPSCPSAPLMLWIVSYRFDARTTQHRR